MQYLLGNKYIICVVALELLLKTESVKVIASKALPTCCYSTGFKIQIFK